METVSPERIVQVLEMANHQLFGFWNQLTPALRTGMPQNEAKAGGEPFAAPLCRSAAAQGVPGAMSGISRHANLVIAQKFPWERYASYVDIGTARGELAAQIALQHPHLTGIGFDLPEVGGRL